MPLVGLILVTALLVVAPGWLLLNAVLPPRRSRLSWIERSFLAVVCGGMLLALTGVVLGLLPHGEHGLFSTFATGLPSVEIAMLAICVLTFYVGLQRGAYPRVAARFPRLSAPEGKQAPAYESR